MEETVRVRWAKDVSVIARINVLLAGAIVAGLMALAAMLSGASPASAHLGTADPTGWGSVPSNRYMDYDYNLPNFAYAASHGVYWWNDLEIYFGDGVWMRVDTPDTTLDLWMNEYRSKDGTNAYWAPRDSPYVDVIRFNYEYMWSRSAFKNRGTATHELGHSLGFGHAPWNSYGSSPNSYAPWSIMYVASGSTGYNTPLYHDDDDFWYNWVYWFS